MTGVCFESRRFERGPVLPFRAVAHAATADQSATSPGVLACGYDDFKVLERYGVEDDDGGGGRSGGDEAHGLCVFCDAC